MTLIQGEVPDLTGERFTQLAASGGVKQVAGQMAGAFTVQLTGYGTDSEYVVLYDRATGQPVRVRRSDKEFCLIKPFNPERRKIIGVRVNGGVTYVFARPKAGVTNPQGFTDYEPDPDAPPLQSAFSETPLDPARVPIAVAPRGGVETSHRRRRRGSRGRKRK